MEKKKTIPAGGRELIIIQRENNKETELKLEIQRDTRIKSIITKEESGDGN